VERLRDFMEEKGDHILWVVRVEGKESWQIRIVIGVETLEFGC
jgi:hypothetical protein